MQRTTQLIAVVHALADDQLTVHRDAGLRESRQQLERFPGTRIAQHLHAQLRIRGLHRNIEGRNVHFEDALHVLLGQIGHGNVVAHQERQPRVIVLDIQRVAHALGQLVDEAEHAAIGAALHLIHQIMLEVQPQRLTLGLAHADIAHGSVLVLHGQRDAAVIAVKFEVEHIPNGCAVDFEQGFAC